MKLNKIYKTILIEQTAASMGYKIGKTTLQNVLEDLNVYLDFIVDPLSAQDSELQSNRDWIVYETKYKSRVQQLLNKSRKYMNTVIDNTKDLETIASTIYDGSEAYEPSVVLTPQGRRVLDKMYNKQLKAWQQIIDTFSGTI